MLQWCLNFLLFLNVFTVVLSKYDVKINAQNAITTKTYALWRNATVPFYVNPAHFDHEQTLAILSALSMFAFKTCIKFKPVMARPYPTDEVMVFINPEGTKRCHFATRGHSVFNPHFVKLGYECLKSPLIEMMIMRALGFPFEHNRDNRDLYIEVLTENIEPGNMELFTKEDVLPLELRFLPYDVNSVMHFGNRDYSKNGHRTIIFKDPSVQQNRLGLTTTDIKKIEIVYGPECRARDRQEKVELCQSYPGVARKKRQTDDSIQDVKEPTLELVKRNKRDVDPDAMATKSLRVNPDITAPPVHQNDDITKTLKELGIDEAVQDIVDQVYKVSSLALKNARVKYCNDTNDKPSGDVKVAREGENVKGKDSSDILGIIEVVAEFAKGMVDHAVQNLTKFCENSEAIEVYQRYSCDFSARDSRCRNSYRSTKSGAVQYSTQHRPLIRQSTRHQGGYKQKRNYGRVGNATGGDGESTTQSVRRKRDLETTTAKQDDKDELKTTTSDDNKIVQQESLIKATANKAIEIEKKDINNDKENVNKEKKERTSDEIKENEDGIKETSADSKEKAVKAETNDIKAKSEGKMIINNKEILRMATKSPGLDKKGYNRRLHGPDSDNSASAEDLDALDTILAKKIIKKKHIIQKNHRKEKRKHKNYHTDEIHHKINEKKHKKDKLDHMAIPIEAYVKNYDDANDHKIKFDSDKQVKIYKEEEESIENIKAKRRPKKKIKQESDEENIMKEPNNESVERPRPRPRNKKNRHGLPRTVKLSKKNKEFYHDRRWPRGELVYVIQVDTTYDLSDMKSRLAEVRDILKEKTCVKMKEIKTGEANKYDDYIVIDNSPDYVTGRVGGEQRFGSIELFRGGQHRQHAAMMVMAMLGFYFEVSRHDRDKFIRVHMRHVRPDKLHHFEMIRSDATLPVPYDYASATHPAWQFWRQIGRTGISTVATYKEKDPDGSIMKSLGQNENILSDLDIVKINSVYGVDCFRHPRAQTLGHNNDSMPFGLVED